MDRAPFIDPITIAEVHDSRTGMMVPERHAEALGARRHCVKCEAEGRLVVLQTRPDGLQLNLCLLKCVLGGKTVP